MQIPVCTFLCFPVQRASVSGWLNLCRWKGSCLNESKNQFSEKCAPAICHLQTCYYYSELAGRAGSWPRTEISRRGRLQCAALTKLLHLFCASCRHRSLLNFNAPYTYRRYINSIYWHRCHAVDRNYGHLLYLSPSAARARQRGKRSFACDNDVTPEITAAVLILAVRAHLSAPWETHRAGYQWKRPLHQLPALYSSFVLASNHGLSPGEVA